MLGKRKPAMYDQVMKLEENTKLNSARKQIIQRAYGRVLEIGSGTGINFPLYKSPVTSVDAIEPNPYMIKKSNKRKQQASIPIHLHQASAEELPFANDTFDSVVSTLVFCTIPDPDKALAEIKRVAKPGARILFLEHVKMPQPVLAKAQDVLTPIWKRIADGCHLNRDTFALIQNSNLQIEEVTRAYKGLLIVVRCINSQ